MNNYSVLNPNRGIKSELVLSAISILIIVVIVIILKKGIKKRAKRQGKEEKHPFRIILKWYYILIAITFPFYLWLGHESHNDLWSSAFLIGVPIGISLGTIGGGWIDTIKSIIATSLVSALVLYFGKVIPIVNNNFVIIVNCISSISFIISGIAMYRSKGDLLRKQDVIEFTGYVGDYKNWGADGQKFFSNGDIEVKKSIFTNDISYIDKNTGHVIATGKKNIIGEETITDSSGNTYKERKGALGSKYIDSNGNTIFKKEKNFLDDTIIKDNNGNILYKEDDNFFSENKRFKKK